MTDKHVIIGDGAAGATAAETIRENDGDAEITVFTDESEPLYNRIMLKTFMKGSLPKQYTRMHNENWYEKRDIKLHLETRIENVDTESQVVETAEGDETGYDNLLIATGGNPRRLPYDEGHDNVYYMWTMGDAERIKDAAEESDEAVVIGGGLLGIDLAVAFAENDAETHYLIRESEWWHRGLDEKGAEIIHDRLEEMGVKVVTETETSDFQVEDGEVTAVETDNGIFECDSVAVAIGQTPNSGIIDVEKNDYDMIKVCENLVTSDENVYAAGNMVEYDSPVFEKRTVNGSWDHSEAMGEYAAENMLGNETGFDYVNTYGVGHFDVQFLAVGDWSGEPISKKYNEDEYRRLFFDGDRLVGAVMIGFTKGQDRIQKIIQDKVEFDSREELLEKEFWE
jgi:3-phenylpropionate/trans-cinnamate dioxygenase ferredoxin reductase subunit